MFCNPSTTNLHAKVYLYIHKYISVCKNRTLLQKETGPFCGVLQPLHKPSMQQYICIFINTYMYICICTHSYIYIDHMLVWSALSAPKNGPIFFGRGSCFFYTPSTEWFGALTAPQQNTIFTKCICLWKRVLFVLLAANAKSIQTHYKQAMILHHTIIWKKKVKAFVPVSCWFEILQNP